MEKHLAILLIASGLIFGFSACTPEQSALDRAPGKYEKKTVYTDADGTVREHRYSTEVDEDEYGNRKAVVKSKTTKDPKGLFNKTTTSKSKQVIQDEQY